MFILNNFQQFMNSQSVVALDNKNQLAKATPPSDEQSSTIQGLINRYQVEPEQTPYAITILGGGKMENLDRTGDARGFVKAVVKLVTNGFDLVHNDLEQITSSNSFKLIKDFDNESLNSAVTALNNAVERETGENPPTTEDIYIISQMHRELALRIKGTDLTSPDQKNAADIVLDVTNPMNGAKLRNPENVVHRYAQFNAASRGEATSVPDLASIVKADPLKKKSNRNFMSEFKNARRQWLNIQEGTLDIPQRTFTPIPTVQK